MINISLKKAYELSRAGLAKSRETLSPEQTISIYSTNVADELSAHSLSFAQKLDSRLNLVAATFQIRELINLANSSHGISSTMTQLAEVEAKLALFLPLEDSTLSNAISTKMEIDKLLSDDRRYTSTVEVSVIDGSTVMTAISLLRKQKAQLRDRIAQLNSEKTIEVTNDIIEAFATNGIY